MIVPAMVDNNPPLDIKNVAECKEAQYNEIAALQAIFMSDFEQISDNEFNINLTPYPAQEKNNFSSVSLVVGYTPTYPISHAFVHLDKCNGLTEKQFNELAQLVAKENELDTHQEKIFDLTQIICEYLQVHNTEPLSLHDEMERRRVFKSNSERENLGEAIFGTFEDEAEPEEDVGLGLTSIFDDGADEVLNRSEEIENIPVNWERKHLIGTGPNGDVYAGINTVTQTPIIIKEIVYESSSSSGDSDDGFGSQCALMMKEIDAMTHLKHANLARYLGCEREGNTLRIFQEPVAYSNVKDISYPASPILNATASLRSLPTRSYLDEGTIRKHTRQILHALLYLHTHHVAHRNLKCTNILVESSRGSDSKILLSDYGGYHRKLYDYLLNVRGKNAHYYLGTHAHHTPAENAAAQQLARKDDVFQLALCIISMAGGVVDETGEDASVPEHLSRAGRDFLNPCLKRDPQERPEVAALLKHPFVTQPYTPSHPLSMTHPITSNLVPAPLTDSPPSSSSSASPTSSSVASTVSSFASSNQSHLAPSTSDTSTNATPIPTLSTREIAKKNKSANALASSFVAARSDDDSSASSASATSNRPLRIPSRYHQDFEELETIGRGGFGIVVKAKNRLDGRFYAIKKIKIDGSNQALTTKMLREVTTLSRLHHQYVVRYYQAWIERADFTSMAVDGGDEDEDDDNEDDEDEDGLVEDLSGSLATEESEDWFEPSGPPSTSGGIVLVGPSPDRIGGEDEDDDDEDDAIGGTMHHAMRGRHSRSGGLRGRGGSMRGMKGGKPQGKWGGNKDPQYLYIQMEYCPKKTLRNVIDEGMTDSEENWYTFRQIIEGLSHIHKQGIIHRDLKPANIFIDDDDSIKIGDFGLATTGPTQRAPHPVHSVHPTSLPNLVPTTPPTAAPFGGDDSWGGQEIEMDKGGTKDRSMTGGVGTYFYCCPELLHRGTKHYGAKVDMYSAGIIFFEMCHRFSTEMERANTLNALRLRLEFPVGFEAAHPQEAKVIQMLLQHDPDLRPDTLDLLKSDLLPARMEEEKLKEAIKTIANPNQGPMFSLLLDRLFSLPPDDHILQTFHYSSTPFSFTQTVLRDSVFASMRHIFHLHGAIAMETPLLLPKHSKISHEHAQTSAHLLDSGGVLVGLPYDLTFPWARYVAQHRILSAKRYTIGKVYRRSLPGSAPRELWECDFDIIGPPQHHITQECEVIITMSQILDEYTQQLGPYAIGLNHYQLVTAVLDACEVPRAQHPQVLSLLTHKYRTSWSEVASAVRLEVSARCANMMEPYFADVYPPGSINVQLDRLAKLLTRYRGAQLAIADLRTLARHLSAVGILPKMYIDLSLIYHSEYYDGVLFQAILQKGKVGRNVAEGGGEVVMAGGRYDGLVKMFSQQQDGVGGDTETESATTAGAVGVNIAVEKLVSGVLAYEMRKTGRQTSNPQHHHQQDLDVVVCSIGSALTEEKMSVVSLLWMSNVRADYIAFESPSVEELTAACRDKKIPWIIVLKDRSYNMRGVVRLRNVETRAEMDLSRKDVAAVVRSGNAAAKGPGGNGSTSNSNTEDTQSTGSSHSHARSASAIVFSNVEIVVLHTDQRGANRKIIIQAQQDMARVLRALSPNAIAKVACVDLPVQVCREVVTSFEVSGASAPSSTVKLDRAMQQRIATLKNLLSKWKSFPIVFVYSYRDGKYVALAM